MSERRVLHLVDGSGYIFRAYYAVAPLSTSKGLPTNAVVGFARMLVRLLKDERPELLGIAFDAREKTFRHHAYPAYKANREKPPEDLEPQFELIHELVDAMDIPVLIAPGFEADDILATLTAKAVATGYNVVLVSGDKDLMQLVGAHVTMFDPLKVMRYDRHGVIERFGVPPELVADALGLAGDSSDNIPGVPGIGPKNAAKLIAEFGDVEKVLAGLAAKPERKKLEQAVLDNAEQARLSKRLTVLCTEAAVPFDLERLRCTPAKAEKLGPFLSRIEAYSLLADLAPEARSAPKAQPAAAAPGPIDRSRYRTILRFDDLGGIIAAAQKVRELSVDLETTSIDPHRADIVGISLCVPGEPAAYVPVAHHYLGVPAQLRREDVLARLRPVLEDPGVVKIGQNIKYDLEVLARAGIALQGIGHDSMLAAWVLDPSRPSYSLDTLAREYLGHQTIRYRDVTGTGKTQLGFDEVDVETATRYSAEDADVAVHLRDVLVPKLDAAGLGPLYRELEVPLVPVLARMERAGILVDVKALSEAGREFEARMRTVEAQAHSVAGESVNLASPKQLAELFFVKLGYRTIKKTKTGFSTDQEVLEELATEYDLPRLVLEHRLLSKLKSTYVDALVRMVNPDTGRVHTSFNQTGTATGRLSSSDPNLQNIPVRTEDGRRIRQAFIAAKGCELISADYSQIELRVMAHLSQDERFIAAFERGEDIHTRTASEILTGGRPPTGEERRRAKAINFGILYGLSEFGLAKQLGISRTDAKSFITAYFARYPGIRRFLDATIAQAQKSGFVTTLSGRRRFLPELASQNRNVRQGAERIAMNTPIQGSAADIIKLAMLKVDAALTNRRLQARLLLQVHDELVLEVNREQRDEAIELVKHEMSRVMPLRVPLVVDVGCGPNWAKAH